MTSTEREMPREEIGRHIDHTLQQLDEQRPFEGLPGEEVAPPSSGRRRWLLFAGLGLIIAAELAVLGVSSRMEDLTRATAAAQTPCQTAVRVVELGVSDYRKAHGLAPESLERLVPDYLPAVPQPSGASLQYRAQGEGFSLRCTAMRQGGKA